MKQRRENFPRCIVGVIKGGLEMKINNCSVFVLVLLFLITVTGCISMPQNKSLERKVDELELRIEELGGKKTQHKGKVISKKIEAQKETEEAMESMDESDVESDVIGFPSNEEIQNALKNAGFYNGKIDGQIGSETRKAIKEFQRQNDLRVDGIIGRNTWETLGKFFIPAEEQELEETEELEELEETEELEEDDSLESEEEKQ